MDIDNGSEGTVNRNLDLEQSLLQQFSCMGTTDRDELVQQLQKFLGCHLNYSTAAFFLDMNNWNLQAAICSYLDVEAPYNLPSVMIKCDPIVNENESIEPNTKFQKTWQIWNNGTEAWPAGCHAQCSDGNSLGGDRISLPCLPPGQSANLVISMTSPSVPGLYQSKWRLCSNRGAYFGDPMWAIITVVEPNTIQLTQQLSQLNELGSSPSNSEVVHNPFITQRLHTHSEDVSPSDGMDSNAC